MALVERQVGGKRSGAWLVGLAAALLCPLALHGQTARTAQSDSASDGYQQTTDDYNRRLTQLSRAYSPGGVASLAGDYRIGPDDLLEVSILEAPELDRTARVSATGNVALALVGTVRAAGLTTQELGAVVEEILRRDYIKDPHVTVQIREMQSHPVSVFGAVKKPGVFQIRGPKSVIEMLSMAEGLDEDAGDTVIIDRHDEVGQARSAGDAAATSGVEAQDPSDAAEDAPRSSAEAEVSHDSPQPATGGANEAAPSTTVQIDLKKLLATGDSKLNVAVYPGDVVKVTRAELVYVVGEVAKPGGFQLKTNENISVLQAVALAQGLTHTSAATRSRIIRTDPATGQREEIPIDLKKVLAGKVADPMLEPRDIVFVPNSVGRTAMYRSIDAVISVGTGVAVYRW
ncbi:MAG TPA: polysaccharide biosynthesis/export family protein [Candidatus Acidoferrum sp.]|nr:polysaccharide biosynthesis/export family protein [Candidatus Acidoferrum sp.]